MTQQSQDRPDQQREQRELEPACSSSSHTGLPKRQAGERIENLVWTTLRSVNAVTVFGICALTFMMVMYALERRGPGYVAAFAVGCLLSSAYGFLSGAWPFGVVEATWAVVAGRRFLALRSRSQKAQAGTALPRS